MAKKILRCALSLLLLIFLVIVAKEPVEKYLYASEVNHFKKVNDVNTISKRNFVLFIGKPSCPYCRQLIIKNWIHEKLDNRTYYIDLEQISIGDRIKLIDKYNISSVPTVIYFKNNHEKERKHSYTNLISIGRGDNETISNYFSDVYYNWNLG